MLPSGRIAITTSGRSSSTLESRILPVGRLRRLGVTTIRWTVKGAETPFEVMRRLLTVTCLSPTSTPSTDASGPRAARRHVWIVLVSTL